MSLNIYLKPDLNGCQLVDCKNKFLAHLTIHVLNILRVLS